MSEAINALAGGMRRFADQHGLDVDQSTMHSLLKKFLVVTANGVDLHEAYPLIGDDLSAILHRGVPAASMYRSTTTNGYGYPVSMWERLFSSADVGELCTSGDKELTAYKFFRRLMATKSDENPVPEWKSALGYYTASQLHRDEHAVASTVVGVGHKDLQEIASQLTANEYAKGLSGMLNHVQFQMINEREFRAKMRTSPIGTEIASDCTVAVAQSNPWDEPVAGASTVISTPCKQWTLAEKTAYRKIGAVMEMSATLGDFVPLGSVFKNLVRSELASPGAESPAISASDWEATLGICDHMQIEPVMETQEMSMFLEKIGDAIGADAVADWTDREAVKKLLTAHAKDWESKWAHTWAINEPLRRAIAAHKELYPTSSPEFLVTATRASM